MPRTRSELEREAKVAEIVESAERRLRDGGFEALSVAAIARELGVAQNAIYWYFPSKDHLFVAALEGMLLKIAARKPRHEEAGPVERILWFTEQLQALSDLRGAMNARAGASPVIAEFVERLDELLARMLSNVLRDHVGSEELPVAVETFRATVEGTFARRLDKRARREILTFALERLGVRQAG